MSMHSPEFTPYRPTVRPGTFVRNLPYSILQNIARQLDPDGTSTTWRDLALNIPLGPTNPTPRFTNNDIQHFELHSRQGRSATLMLLNAWSTSNPTAQDLVDVLHNMHLPKLANMILPAEVVDYYPQATGQVHWHSTPSYQETVGFEKGPAVALGLGQGANPYAYKPMNSNVPHSETLYSASCKRTPIEHESLPHAPHDISEMTSISEHLSMENFSAERNLPSFSYLDLIELTSNFNESCKLGEGAFGSVFSGHLDFPAHKVTPSGKCNGRKIAIKRLKLEAPELAAAVAEQFKKEIHIISELDHENILPLVGYSCDGPELCLVYDFMFNGSLSFQLECCRQGSCQLTVMQRIKIAEGSAAGIEYLHNKNLVHRDIKSSNILLDTETRPRISDFGLIRSVSSARDKTCTVTTKPIGTPMYMAPEAHRGEVSAAMDVFGFGIVLLELLTSMCVFDPDREPRDLDTFIIEKCEDEPAMVFDHVDKSAGKWSESVVFAFYDLAENALNYNKRKRPTMMKILSELEKMGKTQRVTEQLL